MALAYTINVIVTSESSKLRRSMAALTKSESRYPELDPWELRGSEDSGELEELSPSDLDSFDRCRLVMHLVWLLKSDELSSFSPSMIGSQLVCNWNRSFSSIIFSSSNFSTGFIIFPLVWTTSWWFAKFHVSTSILTQSTKPHIPENAIFTDLCIFCNQ